VTCFRPESNRGPYGLLTFLSAALSTTELWWRMNHRKSFRTLLNISTSCSRTTAAPFCIVYAMYGSAADRCSGLRFQEITFPVRLVCGFHVWHVSRARCHCHCCQSEIELHVFWLPEVSGKISSPHLAMSLWPRNFYFTKHCTLHRQNCETLQPSTRCRLEVSSTWRHGQMTSKVQTRFMSAIPSSRSSPQRSRPRQDWHMSPVHGILDMDDHFEGTILEIFARYNL